MPNQTLTFDRTWTVESSYEYSVSAPNGTRFQGFSGEQVVVNFILTMDVSPDNYTPENFVFSMPDHNENDIEDVTTVPSSFIPTETGTEVTVVFLIADSVALQQTIIQPYQFTSADGSHIKSGNLTIEMIPSFQARKEDGSLMPVIHNGDIMRVLTGATGKIDNRPVEGLWFGYIDRTFYNKIYDPESKFYFETTTVKKPGTYGDELSFVDEYNGGAYTQDTRYYRMAFIYDGNQRGMLGNQMMKKTYTGVPDDPATTETNEYAPKYGKLKWTVPYESLSKRITEIECYRSEYKTHGWERIANIPLADTQFAKSGAEQGESTPTTFVGSVIYDFVVCTDAKITANPTITSHNVFGVGDGTLSHFKIYLGDTRIRYLDATKFWDTGYFGHNLNDEYKTILDLKKSNGTTQRFDMIEQIEWKDKHGESHKYFNADGSHRLNSLGTRKFKWKLSSEDVNVFNDTLDFDSRYFQWGILYFNSDWVEGCGCHSESYEHCYGGEKVVHMTTSTGAENGLVGKALSLGNEQHLIVANSENFILLDHGFDPCVDQTFTVMEDILAIEYTKNGDNMEVTFNDQAQVGLGSHPFDTEISIDVNGEFAKLVNGRLFQGNVVLDPFGAEEKHTDWISYSELGQPDVNPVSNVVRFMDREGGSITGLAKIMDKLVVLKEQAMFMINCPANVSPSAWTQTESIHNIGNIAPRGFISSGDQLFTVFYDGIYKLTANNLADSDKTPTKRLKITDSIQDVYDEVTNKEDITTAYDQYKNELLFTWVRSGKNMIKNGSFHSQKFWDFGRKAKLSENPYSSHGRFCAVSVANNTSNNPSYGSLYSDYMEISDRKHYCLSFYGHCTRMDAGRFYGNFLFYNKQKERIGGYPGIMRLTESNHSWSRYYKNLRPYDTNEHTSGGHELLMPQGARYIRCRSYWYSTSALGEPFPWGWGWTDDWMLEETSTSVSTPSTYETQESRQEIWAYSLLDGTWRRIDVESGMGFLTIDEKAKVVGYDESNYKVRAFAEPEAVVAKITSHPVVINDERSDVVRKIRAKFNSSDDLTVTITPDGLSDRAQVRTLSGTGKVKSERKRVKSRCQSFVIEIKTPDTVNDMEIHNYSVEYK